MMSPKLSQASPLNFISCNCESGAPPGIQYAVGNLSKKNAPSDVIAGGVI
jgi:hypothetical protein